MNSEVLPLDGVSVVTLAVNVPGPVAADRLRSFGATVTTVLPPGGDPLEQYQSDWYHDLHEGHRLVTLNLKDSEGHAALMELLATADVLITSHRPSALRRLGLAPDDLAARFPRLVQVAIVGHPGAEAEVPGHDLTYQAVNGIITAPSMPRTLIADMAGAERAVTATMAGLLLRATTGQGSVREVALSEAAEALSEPWRRGITAPDAILGGAFPGYRIYAAADGYVALAALEPHFYERARTLLEIEGTAEQFAEVLATRTTAQWEAWAQEHDVPLSAV